MSRLAIENQCDDSNRENSCVENNRRDIELKDVVHSGLGLKAMELVDPASSDGGSRSRIGARAIAGADDVALLQVKTAHLALMDRPAVITAGGGSGEGLDLSLLSLFVMSDDAHRVSSFDLFDVLPANLVAGEGIYDHYSLVVEDNRWMKEDLVEKCGSEDAPDARYDAASESVIKKVNVGKSSKEDKAQGSEYVRARGSEELAIVHKGIFSRAREMRAA